MKKKASIPFSNYVKLHHTDEDVSHQHIIKVDLEILSMCAEFDPNPDLLYSKFYLVSINVCNNMYHSVKELTLDDLWSIYSKSTVYEERIQLWRWLREDKD